MSVIVILGMHRSGTSMLAGLLHQSGIPMGKDFIPSDHENPSGYWEDDRFLDLNKDILENAGGDWKNPPDPIDIVKSFYKFEKAFKRLVTKREMAVRAKLWGFKDPRSSLTVEAFYYLLPNPKYLVIKRNENDIVRSLMRRDGTIGANYWRNLCEEYNSRIDRFKSKYKPNLMIVSYESLTDEFSSAITLSNIAKFVGIERKVLLSNQKFIRFVN